MATKTCTLCGATKPLSDFPKYAAMADGYRNQCKSCINARNRHRWHTVPKAKETWKRSNDAWLATPAGKISRAGISKRYRQSNRKAIQAHNKILDDTRRISPVLDHSSPCEICGTTGNIHNHHDDYNKPLEVRRLCTACHKAWHRLNGPGKNKT